MPLSYSRFRQILRDYRPLEFEVLESQEFYRLPMHHALKSRTRLWLSLRTTSRYFPAHPFTVVDLGTYPGSLLRFLHRLLSPDRCRLIGVGLMISDEFTQAIKEDCPAEIHRVNLDPKNEQMARKGDPTRIPIDDGKADLVFALEIIEHMVSPSHLLAEAFRILAPGGHLLITTPNVARIGNVLKLMVGRSNFDRLVPIDYEHPEDEWRPHFREYTLSEIEMFLQGVGFEVVESRHFLGHDTRYNIKSPTQRIIDCVKLPFYAIPHFRTNLLVLGRKPEGNGD